LGREVPATIEAHDKIADLLQEFLGILSSTCRLNKSQQVSLEVAGNHPENLSIPSHEGLCRKLCNGQSALTLTLSIEVAYSS
jgi:hypothetical protein